MKLVSWNVNSLRACVKKGFLDYFNKVDADIFCIKKTKLQEGQIDLGLDRFYQYWNYAKKEGHQCPSLIYFPCSSLIFFSKIDTVPSGLLMNSTFSLVAR